MSDYHAVEDLLTENAALRDTQRGHELMIIGLERGQQELLAENARLKTAWDSSFKQAMDNGAAAIALTTQLAKVEQRYHEVSSEANTLLEQRDIAVQQLAASEARCKIFEEALNDLQNAILDAQHLLDKEA